MKRYAIYGAGSLGTVLGAYITKNGGTKDGSHRTLTESEYPKIFMHPHERNVRKSWRC